MDRAGGVVTVTQVLATLFGVCASAAEDQVHDGNQPFMHAAGIHARLRGSDIRDRQLTHDDRKAA